MRGTARDGAVLSLFACVLAAGCQLFQRQPIRDALSFDDQVREIRRIVPPGTPRDEATEKLKAAGVVGDFATRFQSIYHCDLWNRPNGERWHLNVALLFDERGRLYEFRQSDASLTSERSTAGDGTKSFRFPARPLRSRELPVSSEKAANRPVGRAGERTPFVNTP